MTPYRKLALALVINTIVMYFVTYALLASTTHFYFNLNRLYMAVMMSAPMLTVMLLVMRRMYENARLNLALHGVAVLLFGVTFALARLQAPIGDGQFLRSMIPHHSSAIVMCEEASIEDPSITELCDRIVATQRAEIAEMKAMLGGAAKE